MIHGRRQVYCMRKNETSGKKVRRYVYLLLEFCFGWAKPLCVVCGCQFRFFLVNLLCEWAQVAPLPSLPSCSSIKMTTPPLPSLDPKSLPLPSLDPKSLPLPSPPPLWPEKWHPSPPIPSQNPSPRGRAPIYGAYSPTVIARGTSLQIASIAASPKSIFFCWSGWVFRTFFPLCELPHVPLLGDLLMHNVDWYSIGRSKIQDACIELLLTAAYSLSYILNCYTYALQFQVVIIKHAARCICSSINQSLFVNAINSYTT